MKLPVFQSKIQDLQLLQSKWASLINPFISKRQNNSTILTEIPLSIGINVINHKLGEALTGWKIIRQRGPAAIYDEQDSNPNKDRTLVLISDAVVTVDLECF